MKFDTNTRRYIMPHKALKVGHTRLSRAVLNFTNVVDVEKVNDILNT